LLRGPEYVALELRLGVEERLAFKRGLMTSLPGMDADG